LTAAKLARPTHASLAYYKPGATRGANEDKAALKLPRPRHGRWIDISPLDRNTSGLSVLTTDGELASRLMHPSTVAEREYAVRLLGDPSDSQLQQLESGIELDTGMAKVEKVESRRGTGSNAWHHMTLREARHRDLRPMLAAVGLAVSRVIRVRYDIVELGELYRGATRPLSPAEIKALYALAGATPRPKVSSG
jgi:23S rRNA pseudouridine2605 synthase